ncbi:MAG: type II toxin-antitoxin system Phd/YefM family antitoxin [Spirochaetota bacterium]
MKINPKFLYNSDGKKEQVLLSYEDFIALIEKIEDLEDLIILNEAIERDKDQPRYPIEKLMEKFEVSPEEEEQEERKAQ